jgi:periplasmic copper chaperone A
MSTRAFLLACAVALAGCGEAPDAGADGDTAAAEIGITATNPWVRVAIMPEGSDAPGAPPVNSAGYLVLANPTGDADALVTVETAVSDTAELHTVSMADGVMRMRAVDSIPVPAGGGAVLRPGGYHIMFIGLRAPLVEGDSVDLRLRLRSGRVIDITAPVLRSPPER